MPPNHKTICFDFDGVLAEYKGWHGYDDIGEPIPEMVGLVRKLFKRGHHLKLSTVRLNPYPKDNGCVDTYVETGKARERIEKWLEEQGILPYFSVITGYKPIADIYIDDRGLRHTFSKKDRLGGLTSKEISEELLSLW